MKRLLLLLAAALLFLTACAPQEAALPTPEPTAEATAAPTEAPADRPYSGDGKGYEKIWYRQRDVGWEEDVVFFADAFLDPYHGHPLLTDRASLKKTYNDLVLRYSSTSSESFYDPALREEFIRRVNELILDIPYTSNYDMPIRLAEIAALLGDAHSYVSVPVEEAFPMWLKVFYTDGVPECAVDFAPAGSERLLGSRLTAINGVPVLEIAGKLRPFVSLEAETTFYRRALDYSMLLNCSLLRYIGVMGPERSAVFTLIDPDGNEFETELLSRSSAAMWHDAVGYHAENGEPESDHGTLLMERFPYEELWSTMLSEGRTLYLRFNTCRVDDTIGEIVNEAFSEAAASGKLEKVIVDFRSNGGGYADLSGNFLPLANAMRDSGAELYVLIDGGSFSAAVGIPSMLKRRLENVTLAGTPAGQPTSFFSGWQSELPNSGVYFQYSDRFNEFWPGNSDEVLTPDLVIPQTYSDFLNGVDSVLYRLLEGGE